MSTIAKVFTVLNLVLALFLVGANASMLSQSDNWRIKHGDEVTARGKDRETAKADLDRAIADRNNFEQQNRTLTNQLADRDSELANSKSTAESVRNDNNQLRSSVDSINAALKEVKSELADLQTRNKALMDQNDQYRTTSATAEKDRLDAQDDRAGLEGDLKRANEDIAAKEKQLVDLTSERDNLVAQQTALTKLGIDIPGLIGNTVPQIEGKVSAVGPGFVVLSVGENE